MPTVINTRKFSKTKSKIPAAISGKDFDFAAKIQEEKKQKIKALKDRKCKRLEKQTAVKQNKKTKMRDVSSESEEENRIEFDDSEEDVELEENCSYACLGSEDWTIDSAWLGCSGTRCNRWFHKKCINEDVCNMTEAELREYEYFCKLCE